MRDFKTLRALLPPKGIREIRGNGGVYIHDDEFEALLLAAEKVDDLTAQRDAVLALHTTDDKDLCDECYQDYPCGTVRTLTKAVES